VIDVALLSVMRRGHFREGLGIRAIARRTGLSRNTVKKYLAEGILEPQYPRRMSPSKLDAFAERLTAWLEGEQSKGRKQRRSLKHLLSASKLDSFGSPDHSVTRNVVSGLPIETIKVVGKSR
jgi:hypothetical protein